MLKAFAKIPSYVYLASFIGGAALTYIFYPNSKRQASKSKSNGYPRALINCNNDCFINVILQSLAASNKVTEWLIKNKSNLNSPSTSLFDTLADIIIRINKLERSDNEKLNVKIDQADQVEFYAAQSFKRALNAHNWLIQSEEHDCHELFHLIMDVLDEEQLESKKSLSSLNYFSLSHLKENSRNSNRNSFHGYFVSQLQCLDCNYKYPLRLESFYSLSLTLPEQKYGFQKNGISLTDCINNYFKTEHITMKCENCTAGADSEIKKPSKGFIKKQAIAKLPECLCIHIQRNSWSDQSYEIVKQMNYVQFPATIKIDNNSSNKVQTNQSANDKNNLANILNSYSENSFSLKQVGIGGLLGGNVGLNESKKKNFKNPAKSSSVSTYQQYELQSAIVHYGSAHSGHFVSYRKPLKHLPSQSTSKDQNLDDWLQISDSHIKRCKQYHLFSSNVYMLFYDKVTNLKL